MDQDTKNRLTGLVEAPDRVRESVVRDDAVTVEFRFPDPSFAGHLQVVCALTVDRDGFRIGSALCPSDQDTFGAVVDAYVRAQEFIQEAGLMPARRRS